MEHENQHKEIKRRGTGKTFTEGYDPIRIERLKTIVQDYSEQGKVKRYSIVVDGEMVIPINSEADNFEKYKRYVIGNSSTVEVRMYFGESPNFNRHVFKTNHTVMALGSTPEKDVDVIVKEALEKERTKNKIESLEKELKRKNKKIKQYKELQSELDDKQLDIKDLLKEGIQLYGQFNTIRNGGVSPTIQGAPESEVEVELESQPETAIDKHFSRLKKEFKGKELKKAIQTWEIYSTYPELQEEFTQIINQKIKQNGQA
mgnify:CR=1 FL=1|tara:strand:+ start:375 stop:1151 length:777 start_codon:yes stop_codon:yes gene_type:complete